MILEKFNVFIIYTYFSILTIGFIASVIGFLVRVFNKKLKWICPYCNKKYKTIKAHNKHIQQEHY